MENEHNDTTFSATLKTSSRELTVYEEISAIDTSVMERLNDQPDGTVLNIDWTAVIGIHNDMIDNKDYDNYVIHEAEQDMLYYTGSRSFYEKLSGIMEILKRHGQENARIEIIRVQTRNQPSPMLSCKLAKVTENQL